MNGLNKNSELIFETVRSQVLAALRVSGPNSCMWGCFISTLDDFLTLEVLGRIISKTSKLFQIGLFEFSFGNGSKSEKKQALRIRSG